MGCLPSVLLLAAIAAALPLAAHAVPSNAAQPFDNLQPSLALNEAFATTGVFPSPSGAGCGCLTLGMERVFAFGFSPMNSLAAAGQQLSINQNLALFSTVGNSFGGNGQQTFALPDLQGRAVIGAGQGAGLSARTLGSPVGMAMTTLTGAPGGGVQPFSNVQPSLPLTPLIDVSGHLPSQTSPTGLGFVGQIVSYAGAIPPAGYDIADGRLLPIAQNQALFSVLGTTYGGNGVTTFALPNLLGRTAVGASVADPLGTQFGQETVSLSAAQTPAGGNAALLPFDNRQPSLAVNYLISLTGNFLALNFGQVDSFTPAVGEVAEFAGSTAPDGWAFADGQLLPIQQFTALFAEIGTTYGGNGFTTFALPDLRGRTDIGIGDGFALGQVGGADFVDLAANQVPAVTPLPVAVPEPGSVLLLAMALGAVAAVRHGGRLVPVGGRAVWAALAAPRSCRPG